MPGMDVEVLSEDPWVLKFPHLLDDEEIEFLLDTKSFGLDWKEASDTGALDEHGRHKKVFSSSRSTGVIWCNHHCHTHGTAARIRHKIGELTRTHPNYFESFQFLRYNEGQYYKPHHDASSIKRNPFDASKHRIYTFFLYLNDVQDGGETTFPQLGLRVKPSRGSALLWPSVKNDDPWQIDHRTQHSAEPVKSGVKYSMNIWIHQGVQLIAHNMGCSGSPID